MLDPCGVHHCANVVHALLQGREVVDRDPVGQARTALVEHDQARKRCKPP